MSLASVMGRVMVAEGLYSHAFRTMGQIRPGRFGFLGGPGLS